MVGLCHGMVRDNIGGPDETLVGLCHGMVRDILGGVNLHREAVTST